MKLAHLATIDVGIKYLLLNQLQTIRAAGHEVHAICRAGPLVPEIEAAGISVHTVAFERKIAPGTDMKALLQLYRVLRREQFELIHTHTPKASLLGQWAARMAGVPRRVHTIHGLYMPHNATARQRRFWYTIEKLTMQPAQLVLSQSREDVLLATQQGLCPADRLLFLGNGIDIQRFDPTIVSEHDKQAIRDELNLAPDRYVVGMVGRLVAEKGFFELFEAARRVTQLIPNVSFVCIGPIEPDKSDGITQAQMQAAQQAADMRFLGMRHDLPRLYASMNLLVHPSHREGFPRVPMEGAAMGLPLILTDIRGCREVVTHQQDGLLIPVRDPQALTQAIVEIFHDQAKAQRLGQAAYQRARREFDEQVVFQRVLAAYQQLQ